MDSTSITKEDVKCDENTKVDTKPYYCPYYCYIIKSINSNRTYNGSTNNLTRRLRQHNGEIVGGARRTSKARPWEYIAIVTGFPDRQNALSCEWKICHPTGNKKRPSRFNGPNGRILGLNEVLQMEQWTSVCKHKNSDMKLSVWVAKQYTQLLTGIPKNITIKDLFCDSIDQTLFNTDC